MGDDLVFCVQKSFVQRFAGKNACECSDLTILRIEKGDRFVPDYEVKALAKVFNVSYESLLDD